MPHTTTAVVIQPSYIPWRGYFDLIRRSDVFVFYDDVQYDKHGWRNRNRIKTPQGLRWLTIPVHAKGNTLEHRAINEIEMVAESGWNRAHLERLRHSYGKAPHYARYADVLEQLYVRNHALLADFTIESTIAIAGLLGIGDTRFVRSSDFHVSGTKTSRLLNLLRQIGATQYISGPSARSYIDEAEFAQAGITLEYITYGYEPYEQLYPPYESAVSVLDLLFMKGPESARYIEASDCGLIRNAS